MMTARRRRSARDKLREHFEENLGRVIGSEELRTVAGISEWARRVRELRDDEGYRILSNRDRASLRPGDYLLETLERQQVAEGEAISGRLRTEILERDGYTCQVCGAGAGEPDRFRRGRRVRLHVDHIVPRSQGGPTTADNLRALCSACNQGRQNIQAPSESALNLVARIRRAPRDVQREIYEMLRRSFDDECA